LTYNNIEFDEFEEIYEKDLKKNFNNLELENLRDLYANFRNKLNYLCKQKNINMNISNLKWIVFSSTGKLSNNGKRFITLDNTNINKFEINLKFIYSFIEKYPYADSLRFKIPFLLDDFIKHFDNFIIYHSNLSYRDNVEKFIKSLKPITMDKRNDFFRSDIGKDTEEDSDTQAVIKEFTLTLEENFESLFISSEIQKNSKDYEIFKSNILKILLQISLNAKHRI
jgi:hypothetical protein